MDTDDVIPHHILGIPLKRRTRIHVAWILPACLELLVYLTQMTADAAVTFQHFHSRQYLYAGLTFAFLCAPAVVSFLLILMASSHWTDPSYSSKWKFLWTHFLCTIFFPFWMIFCLSRKLFWSVEALYHDDDMDEMKHCISKALETSFSELYNFIKAYAQSAPQIILQLYHMLNEDLFRDYQTTTAQSISLVFSAIDLAAITMTYQRFESQKTAGRHYPWASSRQMEKSKEIRMSTKSRQKEISNVRKEVERKWTEFPENDRIFEEFQRKTGSLELPPDEVDTGRMARNADLNAIEECSDGESINVELPPSVPAPKPPELRRGLSTESAGELGKLSLHRLSKLKDMMIVNAELYIKDNCPRPPKMLVQHVMDMDHAAPSASAPDETDFFMPKRKRIVNGIEQDDFGGKVIAFVGWVSFITMRMLSLATFSLFYTRPLLYLCLGHYLFSLVCLFLQTRCRTSWTRMLCYFVLAYVYIFVILEFKIKFKRIRWWYIGFFVIMMAENLTMTILWYTRCEFESWWFGFIYDCIMWSGGLFTATLLTYYCILRPKDVFIYVDEE